MFDYLIVAFILLVVVGGVAGIIFILDVHKARMIVLVLNPLFFLKDSAGQSPGKRLLGIKIVRRNNFKKPNVILPFIRNLFLCLGIIEVIVILPDENHERLGDKVTKTIVVKIK